MIIMTQPGLTYVVHLVALFMHAPRTTHLIAMKRFFRYLIGAADLMAYGFVHPTTLPLSLPTLKLIGLVILIVVVLP